MLLRGTAVIWERRHVMIEPVMRTLYVLVLAAWDMGSLSYSKPCARIAHVGVGPRWYVRRRDTERMDPSGTVRLAETSPWSLTAPLVSDWWLD